MAGGLTEVQGRTYVDLQMLSTALGGTLTFEPDHISLTISGAGLGTGAGTGARGAQPAGSGAAGSEHLSVNFRSAGVSALGEMRQWQGAVESVITYAIPVVGTWPTDYRERVEASVNQAKVFAVTDDDRGALQLLQNDFATLRDWSDTVTTERKNLNAGRFVDPDALKKDTTLGKINDCSRFLAGMLGSGVFSDNSSCH
jgi:hypothetical protein